MTPDTHWAEVHTITGHGYPDSKCTCQLCDGVTAVVRRAALAQENYLVTEKMRQDCALRIEECSRQHQAAKAKAEHINQCREVWEMTGVSRARTIERACLAILKGETA